MDNCAEAIATFHAQGVKARLVSMPRVDVFEAQDRDYREQVLPDSVRKRVAVEAAAVDYWRKIVGLDGKIIGMQSFGESAPGGVLMQHFGFTAANVVSVVNAFD